MTNMLEDNRLREIQMTGDVRAALAAHPRLSKLQVAVSVHCKSNQLDTIRIKVYAEKDEQAGEGSLVTASVPS